MSFFKKDKDGNSVSGDVSSQLAKIIEHLSFLEKKLDSLLESSRGGGRSFGGGSSQNRGFRGRPGQGQGGGSYRPGPREVFNSSRPSRPSNRPGGGRGDHRGPRRPFNPNGNNRPSYRPDNRPDSGSSRPAGPAESSSSQEESFNA